jgi:hypothetical protein
VKNHGQKADATILPCHLAMANVALKAGQKVADPEILLCHLAMANVALKVGQTVADPEIHLCHLAMANVALKAGQKALGMAMASVAPKAALKAANAQNNASSFRNMSTISTKNCATMPTPLANCTGT